MSEEEVINVINEREEGREDKDDTAVSRDVPDEGWGWCVVAGRLFNVVIEFLC